MGPLVNHSYCSVPPAQAQAAISTSGVYPGSAAISWRQSRNNPKPIISSPSYYPTDELGIYSDNWRDHDDAIGVGAAFITPHGTISLRLRNKIRVDMTIDRSVRLINFNVCSYYIFFLNTSVSCLLIVLHVYIYNFFQNNIVLSLSGSGSASALLHPNGRIYQYGSRVEILAHDIHGNNKLVNYCM